MRRIACAIAALVAAAAVAGPASAQRAIVFGDSLSDNGNLAGFGAFPNPVPPYYGGTNGLGRFSNGPVWSEQLFGTMGQPFLTGNTAGNVDLAFGGSRTDSLVGLPPGMPAQVQTFLALGGKFGANDTVVAWGGANNIFQYFGPPALGPLTSDGITANSVAAAGSMTNSVLAPIILAGGKTILVPNLPDLGSAPAYNGDPTSSGAGTLATLTYNNALTSGVRTLAAANPGVNLVQADVMAAFRVILANPAAFGFSNVTQACVFVATCVGGTHATQNTFLFWDTVHPTEAGHALLARYFGLLLNTAPAIASTQPLGEVGNLSTTLVSNAAFDRMNNWMTGVYAFKNGPYVEALGQIGNYDEQTGSGSSRFHLNLGGARVGLDRAFGDALPASPPPS